MLCIPPDVKCCRRVLFRMTMTWRSVTRPLGRPSGPTEGRSGGAQGGRPATGWQEGSSRSSGLGERTPRGRG